MALGGLAGGQSMGHAFGRISIDVSSVTTGAAAIRSAARDAEASFGRIGASARAAQQDVILVASSMSSVRNYMQGLPSTVRPATQAIGGIGPAAKTSAVQVTSLGTKFRELGSSISTITGPLGLVFGVAGLVQLTRFTLQVDALATSYKRQSVAAVTLAGSQAKLNSLMVAYDEATGGAVDKATALADVTRLQAVGFADSAEELTRFVTVSRGIALAMGKQQDYVIGQLQLAIANQSTMRLDQIGLGVSEVKQRIDELRSSNSALTTEMAFQQAVLGIAEEKYGALAESAEAQATGAEKASKAWKNFRLELGLLVQSPVGDTMSDLADDIGRVNTLLGIAADQVDKFSGRLEVLGGLESFRLLGALLNPAAFVADLGRQIADVAISAAAPSPTIGARTGIGINLRPNGQLPSSGGASGGAIDFTDRNAAIRDWATQVQAIERQANEARLDATRQYESQRSETIANYQKSIAREAEDFARQRLRQEQQLAKQIADVREDAVEREREWQADYTERVTEIHADANERIAEIEEDYARDRERAQRDHRDTLLGAAGRLDAQAILEEKRRFARQSQDAEKSHKDRIGDERSNLRERLQDEAEAQQERLQQAREADQERIQDMQETAAEQRRIADEDRAIRLARQAADHQDNLARMDTNHAEQMAKITSQETEKRTELDKSFTQELTDLGIHRQAWIDLQKQKQADSLTLFDTFWEDFKKRFPSDPRNQGGVIGEYASGGPVSRTGLAKLHAGEYVLNPQVTRTLNAMMGGISQRGLMGAMAGGGRSSTLNIHPGAVQVYAAAGMNEELIGDVVVSKLAGVLQGMV